MNCLKQSSNEVFVELKKKKKILLSFMRGVQLMTRQNREHVRLLDSYKSSWRLKVNNVGDNKPVITKIRRV